MDQGRGRSFRAVLKKAPRALIFIKESPSLFGQTRVMQRIVHSIMSLLLAATLVLGGPGLASPTKGAMPVEICAGQTISLVWLDAEGNPVDSGSEHIKCLDCLLFSAPLPDRSHVRLIVAPLRVPSGLSSPVTPDPNPVTYLFPSPRGPPATTGNSMRLGDPRLDLRSLRKVSRTLLDSYQVTVQAAATGRRAIVESAPA